MKPKKPIESLIVEVRGQKVIFAADLAELYDVETRALNQAVKRNEERFPADFRFQLTSEEVDEVAASRSQTVILKRGQNLKYLPWVFTEHGAIMAATVLNSPRAVAMSLYVVRAFVKMREQLMANAEILRRLAEMDRKLLEHDDALVIIWNHLKPLLAPPPPSRPKPRIGFNP